jgi:adenosylcobinamide-phosphate synthase
MDAQQKVSFLVGRDTDRLDEAGIIRATVESVAENTVDGVTAPLFFAVLGGPLGAILYKAVSTLDSTFGYKNDRYYDFGWASARLDDLANYIPARLTAVIIPIAALILMQKPISAARIALRDGEKHASPNSGWSEAAFAGALGIQLGGPVTRAGKPSLLPFIGEPIRPLARKDIISASLLMMSTAIISAVVLIGARWFLT